MKSFKDKVAVVTGASSGIGRFLALNLAGEGCHVALADIDAAGLDETVQQLKDCQVNVTSHIVDVSNREAVFDFAEAVKKLHNQVDLVINNAGVGLSGNLEEVTFEEYEWIMGINFWGVVYGCRAFLPFLKQRPEANLVNISSVHGLFTNPGVGPYCSSKFAVRAFTMTLTEELKATGVKVSCVHPGGIYTNIVRNARIAENAASDLTPEESQTEFDRMSARTSADKAAKIIIKGIKKNRRRVLVGWDAYLFDLGSRLFPVGWQKLLGIILS